VAPIDYSYSPLGDIYCEVLGIHIDYVDPENVFGEVLGGTLRLSLHNLLRCTIVTKNPMGERVVIVNGKLIEIWLWFDHDIDNKNTQPIHAHLSVFFIDTKFGPSAHGLVIQRIGYEAGQYQRIGCFSITEDNLPRVREDVGCFGCSSADEDFAEIIIDRTGKRQRIIKLV
jgi:hypothetical protein